MNSPDSLLLRNAVTLLRATLTAPFVLWVGPVTTHLEQTLVLRRLVRAFRREHSPMLMASIIQRGTVLR